MRNVILVVISMVVLVLDANADGQPNMEFYFKNESSVPIYLGTSDSENVAENPISGCRKIADGALGGNFRWAPGESGHITYSKGEGCTDPFLMLKNVGSPTDPHIPPSALCITKPGWTNFTFQSDGVYTCVYYANPELERNLDLNANPPALTMINKHELCEPGDSVPENFVAPSGVYLTFNNQSSGTVEVDGPNNVRGFSRPKVAPGLSGGDQPTRRTLEVNGRYPQSDLTQLLKWGDGNEGVTYRILGGGTERQISLYNSKADADCPNKRNQGRIILTKDPLLPNGSNIGTCVYRDNFSGKEPVSVDLSTTCLEDGIPQIQGALIDPS